MSKWISVLDRVPEDTFIEGTYNPEKYKKPIPIIFHEHFYNKYHTGYYYGKVFWADNAEDKIKNVDFWMPISELPPLPEHNA